MSIFGGREAHREQTRTYDDLTLRKHAAIERNTNALAELKVVAALDDLADTFKGSGRNG